MFRGISYKLRRNKFRRSRFRRNSFRYNKFNYNIFLKSKAGVVMIIAGIIIIIGVIALFPHFIRNTYEVTVTNKQIINRNNTDEYLIYAQTEKGDIRVFRDDNDLLELKFNSHDLYWAISVNKKYQFKAYGFNIPLLSDYQNIVRVKGM